MNKLFLVALAAIAMVACTNDQVVSIQGGNAIAFDELIIDKAKTRTNDPSLTNDNIQGFNVWGFMDAIDTPIFNGTEVTRTTDGWTYTDTQYWFVNHTYYFAALAPMKQDGVTNWTVDTTNAGVTGLGVVEFTNVNGTEDLLYATDVITTSLDINEQPGNVKLDFKHLLSKIKFTFKNGFGDENTSVLVSNIKMTAPGKGTIDLAGDNNWVLDTTAPNTTLEFGDVEPLNLTTITATSANQRLTFPADNSQEYDVTFDVEIKISNVSAQKVQMNTKITDVTFEKGRAYNFVTELTPANMGLFPITFEVVVGGWVNEAPSVLELNN